MVLSANALKQINKTQTRLKLAMLLKCTERWVSILISKNDVDGDLTKASALQVIREETGLEDSQILEQEPATNTEA